ncbi:uncharacterized protein MELLADRAFT_102568 [Melampsora larici-populina 98AG31]|uniref:Uncharacterized protein n=1 Tax=Melampsora larici-populina (strain 98AG31 / pathotype 3-4-7) TaxID=747676 RepID=F4R770_MELLP|nr:uncharacterized protein MELLADRAFT_102568 [Melampsora larici-populina 98AG31]EGG11570.1 hypothetical protein MELLADRAFT_102568 [Melampsora larici-populina 98AG31]
MAEPPSQLSIPEYIILHSDDPADPQLRCSACNSRTLSDYQSHLRTPAHRQSVQCLLEREAADEVMLQAIRATQEDSPRETPTLDLAQYTQHQSDTPPAESPESPLTPLSYLRNLDPNGRLDDDASSTGDSDHALDVLQLRQALEAMEHVGVSPEDDDEDMLPNEMDLDDAFDDDDSPDTNGWYPFKSKERPSCLQVTHHIPRTLFGQTVSATGAKSKQGDLPNCLRQLALEVWLQELDHVTLPSRHKIEKDDFVVVCLPLSCRRGGILSGRGDFARTSRVFGQYAAQLLRWPMLSYVNPNQEGGT